MDSALLGILSRMDADRYEHWQERAAIMEYDGGLSRDEAEWAALDQVRGKGVDNHSET